MHLRTTSAHRWFPGNLLGRGLLLAGLLGVHLALILGVSVVRTHSGYGFALPLSGPVILPITAVGQRAASSAREWALLTADNAHAPSREWRFSPIDVWPTDHSSTDPSSFTPVSEAQPVLPPVSTSTEARTSTPRLRVHRPMLRMTRWLRPTYLLETAMLGQEGVVVLDILIGAHGEPVEVRLTQSAGYASLDEATLQTAQKWRFAYSLPAREPLQGNRAHIEVVYHCCG